MRSISLILVAWIALSCPALSEKRFALLVGNKNYSPVVGSLNNTFNDIKLVQDALTSIGFKVVAIKDGDRATISKAIDDFATLLDSGGEGAIGFVYYSGHGVARPRFRENYLIPVDVTDTSNDSFWYNALSLDAIIKDIQNIAPKALAFIVFDACRSELHLPTKAPTKGFAPMEQTNGIFIAFSTSPNDTASDVGSSGGPYARALAAEIVKQGQDQLTLFQNVKERVFGETGGQRPWEMSGFVQRVYLGGPPKEPATDVDEAEQAWSLISGARDPAIFESFIQRYPQSPHIGDARRQMASLKIDSSPGASPTKLAAPSTSRLVLSLMTNAPFYSPGDIIKIKLVAASSYVKASAVFPFGPIALRRIEASYNTSEGGLYIPFRLPSNAKPGHYSIPVYLQEIRSRLEEQETVEFEIRDNS